MRVPTAIQASVAMAGAPSMGEAILGQQADDFPDGHFDGLHDLILTE